MKPPQDWQASACEREGGGCWVGEGEGTQAEEKEELTTRVEHTRVWLHLPTVPPTTNNHSPLQLDGIIIKEQRRE